MKSFLKSCSLIALTALPLVACGSKSDSKKDTAPAAREPNRVQSTIGGLSLSSTTDDQNLLGDWSSACQVDENVSMTIGLSFKSSYTLQTLKLFLDTRCFTPALELRTVMNYSASAGNILFNSQRYSTIVHSPEIAASASNSNSCGFNKWVAGVEYDITNVTCVDQDDGLYFSDNIYGSRSQGDYTIQGGTMNLDGIVLTRSSTSGDIRSFMNLDQVSAALPSRATAGFSAQ